MSDAVINGLAGTGGGIIAQLITYPLQTVNTRQQTERDLKKEKRKLGTVDQMFQVIKKEGWERLYGGLAPSLVGTAASQGVYYYFYQIFRNKAEVAALQRSKLGIGDGSVSMLSSLVVAALSGCVNVLLTNPIWVVTRMQTHRKIGKKSHPDQIPSTDIEAGIVSAAEPPPFGTANAVQDIYGEGGFLGFWRGVFPTLIMVSNPSMQFMLYETMLKKLKKRRALSEKTNNGVTAVEIFLLGALAKLGATVVTYPLLVVKVKGLRELENPDRFEQRRQTPVVTEAMGEKKNPKKANLNDHHAIKLVLDESVTEMITSRGYAEDVRMSNLRLALWFLVIVVALFAQFYDKKFPANRDFLILCITLYVALNVVLLMIVYLKEKSAILFVYPPKDSVTSTGLAVSSKFPRYSDLCTLVIASADPKSISANRPVKLTKTVTKFTKDGSLVEGLFCKDVEALIYQYETRRKKSK